MDKVSGQIVDNVNAFGYIPRRMVPCRSACPLGGQLEEAPAHGGGNGE
jgi:hypothetical protein